MSDLKDLARRVSGEPIAWLYTNAMLGVGFRQHAWPKRPDGWTETPLYGPEALAARDARIEQLEAEIARKDEALCFYADPEAYCQLYIPGIPLTDPRSFAPVLQDDGKRARKALAALGSKT